MPVNPTYPGVYIEEVKSQVHTITGVATSIAAFVGYTTRGLDNRAAHLFSFADFERSFGGLDIESELSYAVQQFFANGGTEAYVVRVPKHDAQPASIALKDLVSGGTDVLTVTALSKGAWANNLIIDVNYNGITDGQTFNLTVTDLGTGTVESFPAVTMDNSKSNFVEAVVNDVDTGSKMVKVAIGSTPNRPAETGTSGSALPFSGTPPHLTTDSSKIYQINLHVDTPSQDVTVVFLDKNETAPASALGVCHLLEQKINLALGQNTVLAGSSVQCVPTDDGTGIRLIAFIKNSMDAEVTFTTIPPSGDYVDANTLLQLVGGAANVSHYWPGSSRGADFLAESAPTNGVDGTQLPQTSDLIGNPLTFTGIYALDKVDLFNILCIPDATRAKSVNINKLDPTVDPNSIFAAAMDYCTLKRAFLLIDPPPDVVDVSTATDWKSSGLTVHEPNGAAYFPRLRLPDPLNNYQLRTFAPCGVAAGLYSRIDSSRGVWKAPAGTEATLSGVQGLVYKLSDAENGALNPLGLNCFRSFPIYGMVGWGARTLVGSDAEGSEWKYVPVRRMALFLEESLYRGTKWVVFEPNDEPLWAQIRLNLTAFMMSLYRQGAFQGTKPSDAFFVKCDGETTTQDDINRGMVNILVGFAPLKPAEFVVIKLSQIAGQVV